MVWEMSELLDVDQEIVTPLHILRGHDDDVLCVDANSDLDLVCSGSEDGTAIVFTLVRGRYVRTLKHPKGFAVHQVTVSPDGKIVLVSRVDLVMHMFSINGDLLCSVPAEMFVHRMLFSADGRWLVMGGDGKNGPEITVRRQYDLSVVAEWGCCPASVTAMALDETESLLLVGMDDGGVLVIGRGVE
eukprot:TRINITY_DN3070_c3_g1_i1.p1 TRINITY_DN3070_c3_g1~~TRINITY_DN3070_c3_g1_i1.p1  ORF type:complete len:187 (-),score=51.35 TRINITY_DN3070_c3_g1_i1:265-825(-)